MENANGGGPTVSYMNIVGSRMVGWMENTNGGLMTVS
jgi:hypothetical protein